MLTEGENFLIEKEEAQDNISKFIGKKNLEKVDENDELGEENNKTKKNSERSSSKSK